MTSVPGSTRPTGTISVLVLPSFWTVAFSWNPRVWSLMWPGSAAMAANAQPDRRAMTMDMRMDFISFTSASVDLDLELDHLGAGGARQVAQLHRHRPGGGDVVVARGRGHGAAVQGEAVRHVGGVGGHGVRD